MSIPEQNDLCVQEYNNTVGPIYLLRIADTVFTLVLSHSENMYRLFTRCQIAFIRLVLLFAGIRFS